MKNTSKVAAYVAERIRITGEKQTDITEEAGFDKPNVITMIKQGKTKLPLAKVGLLAKALEVDSTYLLKLCLEEYQPETWKAISPYMEEMLTADEMRILRAIRKELGVTYILAMTKEQDVALNDFVNTMRKDVITIQ